jgi:PAS domain S-box-containing protein
MGKDRKNTLKYTALRRKAAERLKEEKMKTCEDKEGISNYELEILQIELDLQNEELELANKKVEKLLEQFTNLENHTSAAYFTLDQNGNIEEYNQLGAALLGGKEESLKTKRFQAFLEQEDIPLFAKFLNAVVKGEEKETCELRTAGIDGTNLFIRIDGAAIKKQNTSDKKIQISVTDISDHKQMEIELKESKELLFKTLSSLTEVIILVNPLTRVMCDVNARVQNVFGYKPQELIGKKIDILFHENNYREKQATQGHEENKPLTYQKTEAVMCKKNGESFYAEYFEEYLYNDKGHIIKLVCIINDISHRKLMEEYKKRAEKNRALLEEALKFDQLKAEFFANISHELRTPLNIILGTIQLMELYSKEDPLIEGIPKLNRHIGKAKQNCLRLLRLINNLIDSTRIDTKYFELEIQNYDIVKLIKNIALSIEDYTQMKSLNLEFLSSLDKKIIACDPDKIERVILNLLSNAVKFTKPGGCIIVSISDNEESLFISVKDTGIGIPIDKKDEIFERFRQINKSLTRENEGSGIGLSLVKSIIEMHGGTITLETMLGKGSEFIIKLPKKVSEEQEFDNKQKYNNGKQKLIEKINIEFSDIYF